MNSKIVLFSIYISFFLFSCKDDKPTSIRETEEVETITELNRLIEKQPSNASLYFNRAQTLLAKGDLSAAITDLEKTKELSPNNPEVVHLLADTYLDNDDNDKAIFTLYSYISNNPDAIHTKLKLSEFYLILKQYEKSISITKDILTSEPQNSEAFFMQGLNYQEQLQNDRAINAFQSAVENNPELVDAWIILGNLHEKSDPKKAIQYFDNAIRVAPDKPEPLHSKAFLLQNSGNILSAIEIYKKINIRHPDYIPSFLNTGILYMELDSIKQAKEHFNVITQQYPKNPVGYHYLAQAELKKGNKSKAIELAQTSLRLDPSYTQAQEFINNIK